MSPSDRHIPTQAPADRPSFTVKAGGNAVSAAYPVQSIVVSRSFNRIAEAVIYIMDGDPAAQDFKISNSDDFIPGTVIEILAGYHGSEDVVFKGIVIRHGVRVYGQKPSILKVECKDAAVKLTMGRKNAYFYDATDSDIIEEIASNQGLGTEIEPTDIPHPGMVQFDASDWDFIVTRAEANGRQVMTHDGKLIVKAPAPGDAVLNLTHGGNILDFEAVMDPRDQYAAVKGSAWNPADQEMVEVAGNAPSAATPGNMSTLKLADVVRLEALSLRQTGLTDTELQAWADASYTKSTYAKVRGRVRIQGCHGVIPGAFITFDGVGDRFNGQALVSGVRHEITPKNWETDIHFGLSSQPFGVVNRDVVNAPASGLLPGISGLHIALVTALEDPNGEDRIQLRIPLIDSAEQGIWARVAALDAGESRGSFFRPEIGDEVVVGFLNGDPRDPVVLGMLNSSAKPAPVAAADDNHIKGFVTRSGMKWLFDDDKTALSIETPNGNTMVLSDDGGGITLKDENGNTMFMDDKGIRIESGSDINIKASGDITLEGANITVKASGNVKAEGSTGAELSSSGSTIVKGSVVQIN